MVNFFLDWDTFVSQTIKKIYILKRKKKAFLVFFLNNFISSLHKKVTKKSIHKLNATEQRIIQS